MRGTHPSHGQGEVMGPYRARAKEKRGTLKEYETGTETQSKNETDSLTSQPSPSAALPRGTGVAGGSG